MLPPPLRVVIVERGSSLGLFAVCWADEAEKCGGKKGDGGKKGGESGENTGEKLDA